MHRTAAAVLLVLLSLPSLAAVTGTVMTPDGTPVAGARVSIFAVENPDARRVRLLSQSTERVPLFTTQTDARGNWSLESPKDPVVDLTITAAGYAPVQRQIERDEEAGATALFKTETKQGTIRAAGKPLAGATVVLMYGAAEYVARTDEKGNYSAPDPKRARSITVIHPSWAIDEEVFVSGGNPAALNRTLTAGAAITGKVVGADDAPVAKANITVDFWPLAVSGDDGTFTIPYAPANWTSVTAQSGSGMAMRARGNEKSLTLKLGKAATISGRITDTRTKLPVAGASVRLRQLNGRITSEGAGALTDAKGNYSLVIPPGTYFTLASHPAYNINPLDVSVGAGQTVARDFAATPLARVSGVVVNEDRTPVAAAVIASEEASDDLRSFTMRTFGRPNIPAVSGPDGRFSIRVQGDSDLRMRATRKGLPVAKSESFRLGPGDRKSGVVVTVPNGVAVTGKVTDKEGKPLSGVAVTAAEAAGGPRGMVVRQMVFLGAPSSDENPVRTASDGTFTIRVKEGTYDFAFRRDGYATRAVRGQTVSAAAPATIETSLEPAVEITGRVVRAGTGIDGVMINTFSEMGMGASAVTGPDGSFTLSGLSPGDIRANFRKEADFVQEMRSLTAPARDVVIELPAGSRVTGRVIDKQSRKPITSFQAGISTSRSGGGMMMMMPPQLKSFTTDDGSFVLDNVPIGGVSLIASAPGYAQARMNLTLEEGKPLGNIELELDPGTKLVGKVTGPDGAAVSGATVRVAAAGSGPVMLAGGKQTVTDSNGEYTLDALEPQDTNIEVSHPKYLGTRKEITPKGREVRLDVQLSSGTRVTGVVVTEGGGPVPEAEVEAMAGAGAYRSARTDANGQFTFDSLAAARYRFSASKRGFTEGRVDDVDITSGAPIRIVLKSGAILYGQVRGLGAEELQAATVEVRGTDGTYANTAVESTGNFRLEGAPTGTVRVTAVVSRNLNRKTSTPQTVTVAAGESANVDLEFRSDTVVRGRVTRNGRPLASASINFVPKRGTSSQSSSSATTDEQGNYSVTGLESGEYTVYVVDMQRFSPYQTTYEVRGSSTFDIDYAASSLRGRVVDSGTGDPVDDARVQLRATTGEGFRGERAAATDVNGTFTIDSVAPGTYTISADKSGFGNYMTEVTVGQSAPAELELRLSRNAGVTLKVVDARDGRSLNAMVTVFDQAGRVVQDTGMRFGGGGLDSAADVKLALAAGSYTATVMAMGYAAATVHLTSPGNQTVALSPGGRIVLRSTRSDRQRVRLVDASGNVYPRTPNRPPAADLPPSPAEIPLNNVAPGSYTVQVLTNNDMTVTRSIPVTVTEGGTVVVDV